MNDQTKPERVATPTAKRIYVIAAKPPPQGEQPKAITKTRLVDATSAASAIRHVAEDLLECRVASQRDLVALRETPVEEA